MKSGDKVFIYDRGRLSAVVGLAKVLKGGRPDQKNPKSAVADFEFVERPQPEVTLSEIKQSKLFENWALVRPGRFSTMEAPEKFVVWMRKKFPKAGLKAFTRL